MSLGRFRNFVKSEQTRLNTVSSSAQELAGVQFMSINTVLSNSSPVVVIASGSVHNGGVTCSLPIGPSNGQRFTIKYGHGVLAKHVAQMLIVSGSGLPLDTANRLIEGGAALTVGSGLCIDKASGSVDLVYSSDLTKWLVTRITGSTDYVGSI